MGGASVAKIRYSKLRIMAGVELRRREVLARGGGGGGVRILPGPRNRDSTVMSKL